LAKVRVRLFFDLAPSKGESDLEVEAEDFKSLLLALPEKLGKGFGVPLFDADGAPRPYALAYHNGRAYALDALPPLAFKDGDTVVLVPPVGGG